MRLTLIFGSAFFSAVVGFCGVTDVDLDSWSRLAIDPPALTLNIERGRDLDVAVDPDTNRAFVAYYDVSAGDLRLAEFVGSSGNCGSGRWQCEVIDSSGNVGRYPSIDIYSAALIWKLGVAYEDEDSGDLKFYERAFSGFPAPGSWTTRTVVVDAVSAGDQWKGYSPSLGYDSTGDAHISSHSCTDTLSCSVRYIHETSSGGNCGEGGDAGKWQCDIIDSTLGIGGFTSLDFDDDDTVFIAYFDDSEQDLKVAEQVGATTGDCGPFSSFRCTTVDSSGDVGRFAAIKVSGSGGGQRVNVAYHRKDSSSSGAVKFAEYVGSGGNCAAPAWSCWTIDSTSDADEMGLDLDDLGGKLVLSYFDSGDLRFGYEETDGNCGPLLPTDGGGFSRSWKCGTLVEGGTGEDVGAAAALVVDGDGGILIAYSRESTLTGNLGVESAYPWVFRDNFESGDTSAWSGETNR